MKIVTIQYVVPAGYQPGDYAMLHGNGGSGDIDWETPLTARRYPLYPNGTGYLGFGLAPFGNFAFGSGHSSGSVGFGLVPFGNGPFGRATAVIEATQLVTECGDYKYGFACYDKAGNVHVGEPEEVTVEVHTAPPKPTGLVKESYNKTTDVLVLSVVA